MKGADEIVLLDGTASIKHLISLTKMSWPLIDGIRVSPEPDVVSGVVRNAVSYPTTSSPIVHPVRMEKNSFLSEAGDIGANILFKYGLDGTRFGDSNPITYIWEIMGKPIPPEIYQNANSTETVCFGIASTYAQVCSGHSVSLDTYSCVGGHSGNKCATPPPSNVITCYDIVQGNSSVCSGHDTCTARDQCICNSG